MLSQRWQILKGKKISKVGEEQGKRGNVEGLPTQNDKPGGRVQEKVVMEPVELSLFSSVPICHIPLFISINYLKKSGCLLNINRNHSPMVHLIMRPHTELRLDAAHHCLGQPASNPSSRPAPAPTLAHRLQARRGLKEESVRYEAADPTAPTGLLDKWAARCCQSAWGQSQVYTSTKRNVRDLTERGCCRGSRFYMKHDTDPFTLA